MIVESEYVMKYFYYGYLNQVTKAGYQSILSAGYYLDQQIPNPKQTHYEWEV